MWIIYSSRVAMVVNVVLIVFLIVFIHNGIEIFSRLHVSDDEAVSG